MNVRKPLSYYLEDISRIEELSLQEWQLWSDTYPYVQNLKVLLAKKHEVLGQKDNLKPFHAAASSSIDRTRLYEVLNDTQFDLKQINDPEEDIINHQEELETEESIFDLNINTDKVENPKTNTSNINVELETVFDQIVEEEIISEKTNIASVVKAMEADRSDIFEDNSIDSLQENDEKIAKSKKKEKKNKEKKKKNEGDEIKNTLQKKKKKKKKKKSSNKIFLLDAKAKDLEEMPEIKENNMSKSKSKKTKKESKKLKKATSKRKSNIKKDNSKKPNNKRVINILDNNSAYTQWLLSLRMSQSSDIPYVDLQAEKEIIVKKKKNKKSKKKNSKNEKIRQLAQKSVQQKDEVISEVLADLLLAQGHKEKAKKMYDQLSLIFPEKSSFFAAKFDQFKKNI